MIKAIDFGPRPSMDIVSLELAKQNSNIDYSEQDDLFQLYLDGITAEIENYLGIPVLERNVTMTVDRWASTITLPFPVNEVTAVNYFNRSGAKVLVDDYGYLNSQLSLSDVVPYGFDYMEITGTVGYNEETMPADIKNAVLLMFSERELYRENRPVRLNSAAKELLRPYRQYQ